MEIGVFPLSLQLNMFNSKTNVFEQHKPIISKVKSKKNSQKRMMQVNPHFRTPANYIRIKKVVNNTGITGFDV